MSASKDYADLAPIVPWSEPIQVVAEARVWHACRICIALYGLMAARIAEAPYAFETREACRRHLKEAHSWLKQ
jgi:hypothetical protein